MEDILEMAWSRPLLFYIPFRGYRKRGFGRVNPLSQVAAGEREG